jgi:putative transposase
LSGRSETLRLTASFKLEGDTAPIERLFPTYRSLVNGLLAYAHERGITSFKRLRAERYRELRAKHQELPSHYIYTACQMACGIYRGFRKLRRRGRARAERPRLKRDAIFLDDHLFTLDLDNWRASIATPRGRVWLRLLHGPYHERFRDWSIGQAWLVKRGGSIFLKVVFRKVVKLRDPNGRALAIDLNENNITLASPSGFKGIITHERPIRTAYFLKRRRIQSAMRYGEKRRRLLAKYRNRERRRVEDIYHKAANEVVRQALEEDVSTIVMESLTHIRRRICYSRPLNGRLHRWSFRRLQGIIEYKAKLQGLNIVYIDAKGTSSLCPICGENLAKSPNGYRLLKCESCGLKADRDVIGAWNLLKRYVGSPVPPESPQMKPQADGGRFSATKATKVTENQNGQASS